MGNIIDLKGEKANSRKRYVQRPNPHEWSWNGQVMIKGNKYQLTDKKFLPEIWNNGNGRGR